MDEDKRYNEILNEREKRYREYRKRIQEYESSEGYKLLSEMRALEATYEVFTGNHDELKKLLIDINDPAVSMYMWDNEHPEQFDLFDREVRRLLHNYLAAVKSLVDHTRNLVRGAYAGTEFQAEYQARVDEGFKYEPVSCFVQDLRNYALHKSLPAVSATLEFKRREEGGFHTSNAFMLEVDKLKAWKKWSEAGRRYMDTLGAKTKLEEVIDAYRGIVTEFYEWFGERINKENAVVIEEVSMLEECIKKLEKPLGS